MKWMNNFNFLLQPLKQLISYNLERLTAVFIIFFLFLEVYLRRKFSSSQTIQEVSLDFSVSFPAFHLL